MVGARGVGAHGPSWLWVSRLQPQGDGWGTESVGSPFGEREALGCVPIPTTKSLRPGSPHLPSLGLNFFVNESVGALFHQSTKVSSLTQQSLSVLSSRTERKDGMRPGAVSSVYPSASVSTCKVGVTRCTSRVCACEAPGEA